MAFVREHGFGEGKVPLVIRATHYFTEKTFKK